MVFNEHGIQSRSAEKYMACSALAIGPVTSLTSDKLQRGCRAASTAGRCLMFAIVINALTIL